MYGDQDNMDNAMITNKYYEPVWKNRINAVCKDLTDIKLKFDINYRCGDIAESMDNIWNHILSFSPNLKHYSFLVDFGYAKEFDLKYDHLIGNTDNLETMVVQNCDLFNL